MSRHPLLTVVIPTRNRGKYLPYVLKSILEQDFWDVEVVVADNASDDNTAEVIRAANDSRLRYERSSMVLGMSENWERGLSFARGEYVFFLGADDGMMPNSLEIVARLIEEFSPPSITWQKPDYTWPDADPPNSLRLELPGPVSWLDARMVLFLLSKGLTNYGLLPNIYSSFVRSSEIESLRRQQGSFFASVTPDVYSAIALVSRFRFFIFSPYPLTVSGGSGSSNGMANARVGGLDTFFAEAGQKMHNQMPVVPGSITSCVFEALLTANDRVFQGKLRINRRRYFDQIINDLRERSGPIQEEAVQILSTLPLVEVERKKIATLGEPQSTTESKYPRAWNDSARSELIARNNLIQVEDCSRIGVSNVFEACGLTHALVGPFAMPQVVRKLSWAALIGEIGRRFVQRLLRSDHMNRRPSPMIVNL